MLQYFDVISNPGQIIGLLYGHSLSVLLPNQTKVVTIACNWQSCHKYLLKLLLVFQKLLRVFVKFIASISLFLLNQIRMKFDQYFESCWSFYSCCWTEVTLVVANIDFNMTCVFQFPVQQKVVFSPNTGEIMWW